MHQVYLSILIVLASATAVLAAPSILLKKRDFPGEGSDVATTSSNNDMSVQSGPIMGPSSGFVDNGEQDDSGSDTDSVSSVGSDSVSSVGSDSDDDEVVAY